MANEIQTSDKETKLATILKGLSEKELAAYKYFIRAKQPSVAEDKAEEMFQLYRRGSSCDEIRRLFKVYGLGQVVACRVAFEWDERALAEKRHVEETVPKTAVSTQLEMQEFLGTMLAASNKRFMDAMKLYIATGDESKLADFPLPKNMNDLQKLVDMYMKVAGLDSKKVDVNVHGSVAHVPQKVKAEEAEAIVDSLLEDDVVDVESTPVVPALAPVPDKPVTQEEMVQALMSRGMSHDQALSMVENIKHDADVMAAKYVAELEGGPKDDEAN